MTHQEHDSWETAESVTLRPGDPVMLFADDDADAEMLGIPPGRYLHITIERIYDRDGWVTRLVVTPGVALA